MPTIIVSINMNPCEGKDSAERDEARETMGPLKKKYHESQKMSGRMDLS